jgi:hypothetical protein
MRKQKKTPALRGRIAIDIWMRKGWNFRVSIGQNTLFASWKNRPRGMHKQKGVLKVYL